MTYHVEKYLMRTWNEIKQLQGILKSNKLNVILTLLPILLVKISPNAFEHASAGLGGNLKRQ